MIIGVTGLARSGKGEVAEYISKKYNFRHLDYNTNVIIPEVKKRNLEVVKENSTKVAKELRDEFGEDVLAKRMVKLIKKNENVVIEGVRVVSEIEIFKKNFKDVKLIIVTCPPQIRYQREVKLRKISQEDFFARDKFDLEKFGMKEVFEKADYTIENTGTLEELHKKVDKIMKNIIDVKQ